MLNIISHQGNAIKTTMRYYFTPSSVALIKTTTTKMENKYWQGYGEKINLVHCWWGCNGTVNMENSMKVLQKIKYRTTIRFSNSTIDQLNKIKH